MTVITGTPDTRTEHSVGASWLGVLTAVGIPAIITIWGISVFGWDAIGWGAALVWGAVGALAFWLVNVLARSMGMMRFDLLDLLGSMMAAPHSGASRMTGLIVHLIVGALLGVTYTYGLLLVAWPANWGTGLIWGFIVWLHALLLYTSIGGVHPAIRRGVEEDPGPGATNLGRMTPMETLIGHLIYGIVLGALLNAWPIFA